VKENKLAETQASGFYQTNYLKDGVNHFSDPPYCIIKPNFRPCVPVKNEKMVTWKHLYSFKPYGEPREKRQHS
jgi:hypothetical protein